MKDISHSTEYSKLKNVIKNCKLFKNVLYKLKERKR